MTSDKVKRDIIAVKRAVSLIRSAADIFDQLKMTDNSEPLRKFAMAVEPLVKENDEEQDTNIKHSAEIIILTPNK